MLQTKLGIDTVTRYSDFMDLNLSEGIALSSSTWGMATTVTNSVNGVHCFQLIQNNTIALHF